MLSLVEVSPFFMVMEWGFSQNLISIIRHPSSITILHKNQRESASKWLECHFKIKKEEITESNVELADLFEREFFGFLQLCKGENKKYTMWFSYMLAELNDEELTYAFSDYYNDRNFWQTSQGKKIKSFNESY